MERMKLFTHLIYECRKGVRSMALCTLPPECMETVCRKLEKNGMDYFICSLSDHKFNIFFGEGACVNVVRRICDKPLNRLSPEEDFILGTLLGYSVQEQCRRYCRKTGV